MFSRFSSRNTYLISKLSSQQADKKFYQSDTQIRENWNFYSLASSSKTPVDKKWLRALFDSALPARSWDIPVERELPAKIGRYWKEPVGHNFDFRGKSSRENLKKNYIYLKKSLTRILL